MSIRKMSKKQKGFVKDFIETGNATQAALLNYDVKDGKVPKERVAESIGSENLSKPIIQSAIADALPDELLTRKHLALLNKVDENGEIDVQAVSKGLDMGYKVKGSYAPEKKQIEGSIDTHSDIDLEMLATAMAEKLKEEKT